MAQNPTPTQGQSLAAHIVVGATIGVVTHLLLSDNKFTPTEKLVISTISALGAGYVHQYYDAPVAQYFALKAA